MQNDTIFSSTKTWNISKYYEFLSFAKNMAKNIGKNISENLSG